MKKILFAFCLTLGTLSMIQAQTVSSPESPAGASEVLPSYPGGITALQSFVSKNVNLNNLAERRAGVVTIYFMVDADGNAYDYQVLNGMDARYDALVLETVKKIKHWNPGRFGTTPRIMGHKVEFRF